MAEHNQILLFYASDYTRSVLDGLRGSLPARNGRTVSQAHVSADTEPLFLDLCANDLPRQIDACAQSVYGAIENALETTLRVNAFCLLDDLERFSQAVNVFTELRRVFTAVYFDVLIIGRKAGEPLAAAMHTIGEMPHGFCVYYIRDRIHTGVLLNENEIRKIVYDIVVGRIRHADRYAGLYILRVASCTIRRFSLFNELAARRLRDVKPAGCVADPTRVEAFLQSAVNGQVRDIPREAFHYLLWEDQSFSGGRYAPVESRMVPPFSTYVEKFIRANCAGRFDEYIQQAKQDREQLVRTFLNHVVSESAEGLFGDQWIALLEELIKHLAVVRNACEQRKNEASSTYGGQKRGRVPGGVNNLWDYADYLYEAWFKQRIAATRADCLLELAALLIETLDNLSMAEQTGFKKFKQELENNRDSDNPFTQGICDFISGLFAENSDADAYLFRRMRCLINGTQPEQSSSRLEQVLSAESFSQFMKALDEAGDRLFTPDSVRLFEDKLRHCVNEQLSAPVLLLGVSYDRAKHLMKLNEPETRSFVFPSHYKHTLDGNGINADVFLLCEYFRVKLEDAAVADALGAVLGS